MFVLLSLLSTEAAACGMPADYDMALTELMAEIDQVQEIEAADSLVDNALADNPLAPIPEDQRAPSEPPPAPDSQAPLS